MDTPPLSGAVPRVVEPCVKVMSSPFGGGPRLDVTVAVSITGSWYTDGFGEEDNAVVVAARTNWLSDGDELPLLLESPR